MLDLLIRNALVFDGKGLEPAVRDVAIEHGKIIATRRRLSESATQVVDADGLALMPAIIDSHTLSSAKTRSLQFGASTSVKAMA
jgi:N-acyl-D-aspartate/D-glutamate deacylase